MPYVLASVNGFVFDATDPGRWDCVNGSFVVSIRSTGRAGFSANIYRADSSPTSMTDGWHGPAVVHYIECRTGGLVSDMGGSNPAFLSPGCHASLARKTHMTPLMLAKM